MRIPAEWQEVLEEVQKDFPSAVIAGGALRDLLHGKPVKDVDIFVPVSEDVDFTTIMRDSWPHFWRLSASSYANNKGFRVIYGIYQGYHKNSTMRYEIIFINDTGKPVHEDFDINICQLAYDGKRQHRTTEASLGIMWRSIWVCNYNRSDRQRKRLGRMKEKYPDFKIYDSYKEAYDANTERD